MTAEERVDECVNEAGEAQVEQQPEMQQQEGECVAVQKEEPKGECAAEQKEEAKEEPTCVIVNSVITVDTVVEQDGKVEDECHEEVNIKQTFIPEDPMPYGPDESLQDGKGDEEECGFCLFMKAGPCGKRFAAWEACVDDAETAGTNIVEKCAQKTHFLKDCMEANPEYYGPVLQAEKAIDEQTAMEGSKTGGEDNSSNLEPIPA